MFVIIARLLKVDLKQRFSIFLGAQEKSTNFKTATAFLIFQHRKPNWYFNGVKFSHK